MLYCDYSLYDDYANYDDYVRRALLLLHHVVLQLPSAVVSVIVNYESLFDCWLNPN